MNFVFKKHTLTFEVLIYLLGIKLFNMSNKINIELLEAFLVPIVEPLIKAKVEDTTKKIVDLIELRMKPEQPLGVKSIAKMLEYSVSHIYKLVSDDAIPHHKISGGKLLFYVSEINQWIRTKN